jgi:divinyl protochlorophyllide a 8-vinyl-reductase
MASAQASGSSASPPCPAAPVHRIGPNAITRIAEALIADGGEALADRVFQAAGLPHALAHPPTAMVDEGEVLALHLALAQSVGVPQAVAIAAQAGRLTGDYLLANRIPRAAQRVLRWLPRRMAANLLCRAIQRHSWTFAGSGRFSVRPGDRLELRLDNTPLAAAGAVSLAYFEATFQKVFRAMLGPRLTATGRLDLAGFRFRLTW